MQADGNMCEGIKNTVLHPQRTDFQTSEHPFFGNIYFLKRVNYSLISENKGFLPDLLVAARVHTHEPPWKLRKRLSLHRCSPILCLNPAELSMALTPPDKWDSRKCCVFNSQKQTQQLLQLIFAPCTSGAATHGCPSTCPESNLHWGCHLSTQTHPPD